MKSDFIKQVQEHGFAFLRSHEPDKTSAEVAADFGVPGARWGNSIVQTLVPREVTHSTPNTYSGNYGLDAFPFHTDMAHWQAPPRYLMLRCKLGFAEIPTNLIDGKIILEMVGSDILSRAIVRPRRPSQGSSTLLRLFEQHGQHALLRWDEIFLLAASKVGEIAMEQVRSVLMKLIPNPLTLLNAGDTLVIDNWRMLHSRAKVPKGREARKIERVYLETLH